MQADSLNDRSSLSQSHLRAFDHSAVKLFVSDGLRRELLHRVWLDAHAAKSFAPRAAADSCRTAVCADSDSRIRETKPAGEAACMPVLLSMSHELIKELSHWTNRTTSSQSGW